MHVQEAGAIGVVPPDVGPADVQPGEAEISDAVGGGDVGFAPCVVRDTGGQGEGAVGFGAPESEEIAVTVPGRQVRAVGRATVGDDELGRASGVIDDHRPDNDVVDALLDHGVGLVAEIAGRDR